MKRILLNLFVFTILFTSVKAQTDYCKNIKKFGAANVASYSTPLPTFKSGEPVIQVAMSKLVNADQTTLQLGLLTQLSVGANAPVSIVFEDGDKLEYTNLAFMVMPKMDNTASFSLSTGDMDKFRTKKVKSFSIGDHTTEPFTEEYQSRIMAYANCLGSYTTGAASTIANTFTNKKPIEGFWGIKFGSTVDEAKAIMAAKGGTFVESGVPGRLTYTNEVFTQRQTELVALQFVDGKFADAIVKYPVQEPIRLFSTFETITKELNNVYEDGQVTKTFQSPYHKGSGDKVQAIQFCKAAYSARWHTANDNSIQMDITNKLSIIIFYTNGTLDKAKEATKSSDY